MPARLNLLPDPRFAALRDTLRERVRTAADAVDRETFGDVFEEQMRIVLRDAFDAVAADEGTVWLAADRGGGAGPGALHPVFNTGPNAERFVREVAVPLTGGIVSMVYKQDHPYCENAVHRDPLQDKAADRALGVLTCAMIAVPLHYARAIRGVISCVQLKPATGPDGREAPDPPGFSPDDLRHVEHTALVLGRLLDHYFVTRTVGW